MRKHPVLLGLVLLIALGAVLYFSFYRAGAGGGSVGTQSFSLNDKIGVVPVEGVITDSLEITQTIDEFGKDRSIVAVHSNNRSVFAKFIDRLRNFKRISDHTFNRHNTDLVI